MSGKRTNIFGQGKPERPYEERAEDPADVPQRATAAQLASRKIRSVKPRRPAGASSGLSQNANFGAPQQGAFGSASPAPAPSENGANGANGFGFGGGSAFNAGATNSFPPAQASTPGTTFSNSSFPAFGASNPSAGFNPQPPSATGFNFTAGGNTAGASNPFATSTPAPATNGAPPAPSFGGSSLFSTQPQSNPFGGLGQNNATAPASSSMFGATSGAPPNNMFGNASSAPNASSTPAPAPPSFTFGAASSSTQAAGTPATSNAFAGFGTPTPAAAPAQNTLFSGFGANTQKPEDSAKTSQNNVFGGFGTSTQSTDSTTATAPASNLFSFGAPAQKSDAPSTNPFGALSSATPSASTPTSAPAGNPFASLPTVSETSTKPSLFSSVSASKTQAAPTSSSNPFASLKPVEQNNGTSAASKPGLFASLVKPNSTPTATMLGASQDKAAASNGSEKLFSGATLKAPEAPKSGLLNAFSTPQPAKTAGPEQNEGGLFTAAQPKTSSGLFSQTFQPESLKSGNLFKPQSSFSSFTQQTDTSAAAQKDAAAPLAAPKESSNLFSTLSTPASEQQNMFSAPKESAPASQTASMPALTAATGPSAESTKASELPKIPKFHVPKEWAPAGYAGVNSAQGLYQQISSLTSQLHALNERYRQQMSNLSLTADWSSLSLWHFKHASDLKHKIDTAKKQRAAVNGITGNESALSTKRKVDEESPESRDISPSKRARASNNAPVASTHQPLAPTPRFNPPATSTSDMFAKAINGNKPSSSTPSEQTSLFTPKTAAKAPSAPPENAAPTSGFVPSSSTATNRSTSASSGFKPNFGDNSAGGFKPSSNTTSTGGGGGFFGQFKKTAKTYEELAAERKAKAKAEDYDSDDETEEEWSTKYDAAESERLAEEKKKVAATPTFSVPASSNSSGSSTPPSNPFASLTKAPSAAPASSMFTPRAGSPALSTGSQAMFGAPSASQTPASNIFGHLSSGPSSNNQDESDEDDIRQSSEKPQPVGNVERTTPPKRELGESETEDDETLEETMRLKKQETSTRPKGNLLSRMTRDNSVETDKESSNTSSVFGQTNGAQTPPNKPFQFFDFGAAGASTAPPKSDTFAGDQTFKAGTPIKFGVAPATEKKSAAPTFQFQPATPSAADFSTTPAKPPPTSLFNFNPSAGGATLLTPNMGLSGTSSVPSSVFSSRAGTPLSEADTSAASVAEDDEEGSKHAQIDFSQLTEEETNANDIVFHTEVVLAKHQIEKAWANLAKGPLWILKDKTTGKCFVRIRLANGSTPLNYQVLPKLKASVTGSSKKMVIASKPAKEGGFQQVLFAVKTPEIAEELARKYNESLPSN